MQDLPDSITKAIDYINNILSYTRNDQKRIDQYIGKKLEILEKQKSIKNKSLFGLGFSFIFGYIGWGKAIDTDDTLYIITFAINIISGLFHMKNYEEYDGLVKNLKLEWDKEIEFKNRINAINGVFDKILKELKKGNRNKRYI